MSVRLTLVVVAALVLATSTDAQRLSSTPDPTSEGRFGPTLGLPAVGMLGPRAGEHFGYDVTDAGDVNGDGYADFLVGAYRSNLGASDAGAVYLYFGGPGFDTSPDATFVGDATFDRFGWSVAGDLDLNGDGLKDIVIGAHGVDAGGADRGTVYVFFGSPVLGGTLDVADADAILSGQVAGDNFGYSLDAAGDVDGDGYDDLIVGAYRNGAAGSDAGAAYVYFGAPSFLGSEAPGVILTGPTGESHFGQAVAGAGDINGDGYGDLLIGAPGYDNPGVNAGAAYLFYGGASLPASLTTADAGATFSAEDAGDNLGRAVAGVGDLNGDGRDDLALGAPFHDGLGDSRGRLYVFFGRALSGTLYSLNRADVVISGTEDFAYFGWAFAGLGDLDGDAVGDLVVGAYGTDPMVRGAFGSSVPVPNAGAIHVFLGSTGLGRNLNPGHADARAVGLEENEFLGFSVAGFDTNGDGRKEVVAGGYGFQSNRGRVRLLSLSMTGELTPDLTMSDPGSGFGTSAASVGDVNGDGYDDIIVGASDDSGNTEGAYLFFGSAAPNATPDLILTGVNSSDGFGYAVDGAGDVNGDGYDDVIIGAFDDGPEGTAYLFLGGAMMDATPDLILSEAAGRDFGFSVAGAGDFNGDGYDDFLIGAPSSLTNATGATYLYYGGPALDSTPDVSFNGPGSGGQFGISVAGAGDLNGDGYDDVIMGAHYADVDGMIRAGRVRIAFGGPSGSSGTIDLDGSEQGERFGGRVAGAGDVNGDGYDDFLIGSPRMLTDDLIQNGRFSLYLGRASFSLAPDPVFTVTGPQGYYRLGDALDGPGDVNGDGFDDFLVSASGTAHHDGRVFVYFGGLSPDDVPDLTMRNPYNLEFGTSAAGAGDVDGDGDIDLIVGAPTYGDAYLYRTIVPVVHPTLYRVADVTGDRGGFVHVEWTASGYDGTNSGVDLDPYLVERSRPPGTTGYAWEPVATVTATGNARYALVATTYDSTPTTCYRVTAHGANGEQWRSGVACGASIADLQDLTFTIQPLDAPGGNPVPQPVAVPAGGGTVPFTATLTNHTDATITTQVWVSLTLPNGTTAVKNQYKTVSLFAGASRVFNGKYTMPASLPPGLYTFTGHAGTHPDDTLVQTSFTMEKAAARTGQVAFSAAEVPDLDALVVLDVEPERTPTDATASSVSDHRPGSTLLGAAYPNPFNPATVVPFELAEAGPVTLSVFDLLGREVAVLMRGPAEAGRHEVRFDARALPTGTYLVRLATHAGVQTRRITLLR